MIMNKDLKIMKNSRLQVILYKFTKVSKIEEKKHLVRNNSASFIDRKDIKPLKSDIKVLEILNFKSKIDKESGYFLTFS